MTKRKTFMRAFTLWAGSWRDSASASLSATETDRHAEAGVCAADPYWNA